MEPLGGRMRWTRGERCPKSAAERRWIQAALFAIAIPLAWSFPVEASAKWLSGPALQLRAEGRYDSNLLEGGGDGSSVLQPGVGWRLESSTAALEAIYLYELVSYAHGGKGRGGSNHRIRGDQRFELNRTTTLSLSQGFERVYDPSSLSRPGVVRTAGVSEYGRADLELNHGFAPRWTGGVHLREELARIEAPDTLDGAVHAPSMFTRFEISRRDHAGLRYRLQYFDTFRGRDAASNELGLSYGRTLTKTIFLEVEAGPAIFTMDGRTDALPWGSISLNKVWPRASFKIGYERTLFGSTGYEGALWGDSISGVFNWRISEPLRATLVAGAFQNGTAPDLQAFANGFAAAGALEYALGGDLVAQLAWRRVSQSRIGGSGPFAIDLSRNIVALGVSWQLDGGQLRR